MSIHRILHRLGVIGKRVSYIRRIVIPCLLLWGLAHSAFADQADCWHFWKTEDGLVESYSRSIYAGVSGRVWVGHGSVSSISCIDGHAVRHIPSPQSHPDVFEDCDGKLWLPLLDDQRHVIGLQFYDEDNPSWNSIPIPELEALNLVSEKTRETLHDLIVPGQENKFYFLQEDVFAQFDAAEKKWEVLKRSDETLLEVVSKPS